MITALPRAWLGYAGFSDAGPVVRVCAWCPDKLEAEAEAKAAGHVVSHGICPECAQKLMAEQTGERISD
jgi:hypothetical protein